MCRNDGGKVSRGCVQVTSPYSCRMRRIESVGTVELVFVGRLLMIGGDSFPSLCMDQLAVGCVMCESDVSVVRAGI